MKRLKHLYILLSFTLASCATVPASQRHPASSEEFFLGLAQNISLETDFTSLFADSAEREGEKDPNAQKSEQKAQPGTLRFEMDGKQWSYPVEVSVRGNSSRYDCSFKKLSLKVSNQTKGPLAGISKLRINTHCSDKPGHTEIGRVTGPAGPMREGMVYDWMRVVGLPSYLSKAAPVSYTDTSTKRSTKSFALFLESKKDLGRRLGGSAKEEEDIKDQEAFLDRVSEIAKNEITLKGLLFNALIGNADYSLQLSDLKGERRYNPINPPNGMWNMIAIEYGNTIDVVPTDFDVSGVVVQRPELSDPTTKAISGCQTGQCEFQFAQMQKWRAFFSPALFSSVARDIMEKEAELKATLDQNKNLGAQEKKYFRQALDAFVDVLNKRLNVAVITETTRIFLDADLKTACGMENPEDGYVIEAPPGLPVKVLAKNAKSVQVLLLDTRDQVLSHPGGGTCDGRVFLPATIPISTDWPN